MKTLLLLTLVAFTLKTHAQLNKKWTTSASVSGVVYESKAAKILVPYGDAVDCVPGNEYYEESHNSLKRTVKAFDSNCTCRY